MRNTAVAVLCLVLLLPAAAAALNLQELKAAALDPDNLQKYKLELLALLFVVVYGLAYLKGASSIRKLAREWTSFLWHPQGVLVRNFVSYPGTLEPGTRAWRESVTTYRSYGTGRRYCQYALLTLDLKAQQDLFCQAWYLFNPRDNLLQVEVCMAEGCMPPTMLLVATARAAKAVLKEQPGINNFAKSVQVTKDRATTWSLECAKNWTVLAEQSSVFYDLLNTEPAIAKAFALKWFRSALISSEDTSSREPGGDSSSNGNGNGAGGEASSSSKPPRHQLRFVFALPPREQREEINQLMAAVFLLVDLVGSYKMPPEVKKRAQELRLKLEQEAVKKISQSRQGELALKRYERLEAERARARAAGPQALAKFEEKRQRQMQKKEVRKRTVKM